MLRGHDLTEICNVFEMCNCFFKRFPEQRFHYFPELINIIQISCNNDTQFREIMVKVITYRLYKTISGTQIKLASNKIDFVP